MYFDVEVSQVIIMRGSFYARDPVGALVSGQDVILDLCI